jgi:tetratricopeptide (TPR) repeat protein
MMQQLPEVTTALSDYHQTEGLYRAVDIFKSMAAQSDSSSVSLHGASLALLAACQQQSGNYAAAIETLQSLSREHCGADKKKEVQVQLALAKALWLLGDFAEAKKLSEHALTQKEFEMTARTGQAMSRLLLVQTLDDVFSVKDPFRMVVKALERRPPSYDLVTAHLNLGVAEAVYALVVARERKVDVPMDAALREWKKGLTILQRRLPKKTEQSTALEARLLTNMGWGLMQKMTSANDYLERASEFAGQAVKVYDASSTYKEGLGRTLSLTATCCHKTSSAVTAQGLFQSALDQKPTSPLDKLSLRDTYQGYASLCRDWDGRERDAERLEEQAKQVNSSLPEAWQNKAGIHSSLLWF